MDFFHLKQVNGNWFLMSPEGKPFYMRGVNHYGDGSYLPLNREDKYPDLRAWRESIKERHLEWGFNYFPPSIGPSEISTEPIEPSVGGNGMRRSNAPGHRTPEWSAADFAESGMPFTPLLSYPMQNLGGGDMPDVFSIEFREGVDRRCREFCEPLKDNPNLIGYHFCHNPPWHPHAGGFFDWCHQIVQDDREAKEVWVRLMRRIYGTVDRWRETYSVPISSFQELHDYRFPLHGSMSATNLRRDKIAFMKRVCEEWYKVYTGAIRKYDPNHLILGDRNSVHLQPLSDWSLHIMDKYIDVLSINVMGPMDLALREMEQVTCHWDGPILVADSGAGIYKGSYPKSCYMCADADEFEEVYSGYIKLGLRHPQVIGLGWCGFYETQSMRSGLVDSLTDEPETEKVAAVRKWNEWIAEEYPKLFAEMSS